MYEEFKSTISRLDRTGVQERSRITEAARPQGKVQAYLLSAVKKAGRETNLNSIARGREFVGVHFARLQSAAKALAKKNLIKYDGISQVGPLNESGMTDVLREIDRAAEYYGKNGKLPSGLSDEAKARIKGNWKTFQAAASGKYKPKRQYDEAIEEALPLNKQHERRLLQVFKLVGYDAMGRQFIKEPDKRMKIALKMGHEASKRLGKEKGAQVTDLLSRFVPDEDLPSTKKASEEEVTEGVLTEADWGRFADPDFVRGLDVNKAVRRLKMVRDHKKYRSDILKAYAVLGGKIWTKSKDFYKLSDQDKPDFMRGLKEGLKALADQNYNAIKRPPEGSEALKKGYEAAVDVTYRMLVQDFKEAADSIGEGKYDLMPAHHKKAVAKEIKRKLKKKHPLMAPHHIDALVKKKMAEGSDVEEASSKKSKGHLMFKDDYEWYVHGDSVYRAPVGNAFDIDLGVRHGRFEFKKSQMDRFKQKKMYPFDEGVEEARSGERKLSITAKDIEASLKRPVVIKVVKTIDTGKLKGPGVPSKLEEFPTWVRITSRMEPYRWKSGGDTEWREKDTLAMRAEQSYDGKKWRTVTGLKTDPTSSRNQQLASAAKEVNRRLNHQLTGHTHTRLDECLCEADAKQTARDVEAIAKKIDSALPARIGGTKAKKDSSTSVYEVWRIKWTADNTPDQWNSMKGGITKALKSMGWSRAPMVTKERREEALVTWRSDDRGRLEVQITRDQHGDDIYGFIKGYVVDTNESLEEARTERVTKKAQDIFEARKRQFAVGDRVRYKAAFLRSTGMYTGDIPRARGAVTDVKPFGGGSQLVTIDWGNPDIPPRVNAANLELIRK